MVSLVWASARQGSIAMMAISQRNLVLINRYFVLAARLNPNPGNPFYWGEKKSVSDYYNESADRSWPSLDGGFLLNQPGVKAIPGYLAMNSRIRVTCLA